VPVGIPLSWFSLGLTSYVWRASRCLRLDVRAGAVASIALAVWYFVVWDLVLDPAMASRRVADPLLDLAPGRSLLRHAAREPRRLGGDAAVFTTLSRWLWASELAVRSCRPPFPLAMYGVNLGFAMALAASVGLWLPIRPGACSRRRTGRCSSARPAAAPAVDRARRPCRRDEGRRLDRCSCARRPA
jgi:uncharacterized membrane protein